MQHNAGSNGKYTHNYLASGCVQHSHSPNYTSTLSTKDALNHKFPKTYHANSQFPDKPLYYSAK